MSAPSSLESTLTRAWLRRGWLACLLWPLSLLFGAVALTRRALYRFGLKQATRLDVPVVVVGNVFVGGTGKTPLAIWLVQALRQAGYTPGVISRGYGSAQAEARPVTGPEGREHTHRGVAVAPPFLDPGDRHVTTRVDRCRRPHRTGRMRDDCAGRPRR